MASTMAREQQIVDMILGALNSLHEQGVVDLAGADPNSTAELFGEGGLLDSVGLVTLVVAIEQTIEDEFGVPVMLADEHALSQRSSPFRSVASLAAYAASLVPEH